MRTAVGVILVALLLGCTTPRRNEVRVTRNATDVEHCRHIGAVQTISPNALPGEELQLIRDKTVAVGADTVLLNRSQVGLAGVAYRCRATS